MDLSQEKAEWLAIDYGSKLAGTTAIVFEQKGQLLIEQSQPKKSADDFILSLVDVLNPKFVFIDAPLSLPIVYTANGNSKDEVEEPDFFYRKCDRALSAMSPMFLGGLTARAMRLKSILEKRNITCFEIYPKALVQQNFPNNRHYKQKRKDNIDSFFGELKTAFPKGKTFAFTPQNWHQIDACLAWLSAWRCIQNKATVFGDIQEGCIYV